MLPFFDRWPGDYLATVSCTPSLARSPWRALPPTAPPLRSAEWTDGYPRWRVVLGTFSQLVGFPVLYFAFALGRQVPQPLGLASSHTHLRTPTRPTRTLWSTYGAVPQEWLMEFFLLVFACGLVQDCVRFPTTMGPLLLAHHAACLVGILVARLAPGAEWASVFPWFFGGCTALEFGSGFNNIFWLRWLPQRLSELLYLSAMTVSNLVAIACVCAWVRTARWEKWHSGLGPWLGRLGAIYARPAHACALLPAQATPPVSSVAMRGFSLAAIAVLVYHRQKETLRLCRVPVPHWLGRAGPSD